MRIRKRYQHLRAAADLSSTATGGEEIVGAAAEAEAPPPSYGSSEEKGEEEGELHSCGHLHGQASQGLPTEKGGVKADLRQWRDVKQEGENGGDESGGAGATALKSFGGESSKEPASRDEDKTRLPETQSSNPIQRSRSADDEDLEREQEEVSLLERESKPKLGAAADKGKKRRSPAVLMEGSRCSRVNGRGWRCCQQTLVGYSLCEHHLGKGRLRSMNSVKCNDKMKRREDELQASEEELEPEKTMTTKKKTKKRKIGTVKARSMSSLLHQSDVSRAAAPPSSSDPAGVGFCMQ